MNCMAISGVLASAGGGENALYETTLTLIEGGGIGHQQSSDLATRRLCAGSARQSLVVAPLAVRALGDDAQRDRKPVRRS